MSNYYNLDGIKTALAKDIARSKTLLAAWERVTFPTKKDGTPFKIMSKNISGASYFMEEYAMQPGEYRLRVCDWCGEMGVGYVTSEIDAHNLVRYLTDPEQIAKTQNYQPKQTYLEQVYTFDLDDIKKAVAAKIAQIKKEIAQLETQQEIAADVFRAFKNAYGAALADLEKSAGKAENSALYYMILDTVKERYPYC